MRLEGRTKSIPRDFARSTRQAPLDLRRAGRRVMPRISPYLNIPFGIMAWMPLTWSTTWVTSKSTAMLASA